MKKDIIDIVEEKEFIELTTDERIELSEFCTTEEEFNQLKNVLLNVSRMKTETATPRKETKESLDRLFDESFPRATPLWQGSVLAAIIPRDKPLYLQPLIHVAAVALLLIMVVPIIQKDLGKSKTTIAKTENNSSEKIVAEQKQEQKDTELQTENTTLPITIEKELDLVEEEDEAIRGDMEFSGGSVADVLPVSEGFGLGEASVSEHPDGVFAGSLESEVAFSQPASASTDLLDLLTATF